MKKLFILLSFLFILACDEISNDDQLVELYVDMVVAREKFIHNDSLYSAEKAKVLQKYNVTEDQYFSSLKKLKYDDKKWKDFFDKAKTYIDTLEKYDIKEEEKRN